MKKKNLLWKILLALGFVPFAGVLISGIYKAITGFSGLRMSFDTPPAYGFAAFLDWVILVSFLYWPLYIIGGLLIIVSISVMLIKKD